MSKLIYVAIVGATAGIAHTVREACQKAGLEVGAKTDTNVELHSLPLQVVDAIDTPEITEKGKVVGRDVEVRYRAAFTTLAAQQLQKHMHRKENVKVKLLKGSTQISIDASSEDDEADEE